MQNINPLYKTDSEYSITIQETFRNIVFQKKKRTITYSIKQLNLSTMICISKELIEIEKIPNNNILSAGLSLLSKHGETMIKIIGLAVCNNKKKPPQRILKNLGNLNTNELMNAVEIVLKQMNLNSFIQSILYITGIDIL